MSTNTNDRIRIDTAAQRIINAASEGRAEFRRRQEEAARLRKGKEVEPTRRLNEEARKAEDRALIEFENLPALVETAAEEGKLEISLGANDILAGICRRAGLKVREGRDDGVMGTGWTIFYLVI